MNHYKHITLEGVSRIQLVNVFKRWVVIQGEESNGEVLNPEWEAFDKANPPIIWYGPEFEGTISEDEIEKFWQYHHPETDTWLELDPEYYEDIEGNRFRSFGEDVIVRQCVRLKPVTDNESKLLSLIGDNSLSTALNITYHTNEFKEVKCNECGFTGGTQFSDGTFLLHHSYSCSKNPLNKVKEQLTDTNVGQSDQAARLKSQLTQREVEQPVQQKTIISDGRQIVIDLNWKNITPGDQVLCLFGNSGNKSWYEFLKDLPAVEGIVNHTNKPFEIILKGEPFYANDFARILSLSVMEEPINSSTPIVEEQTDLTTLELIQLWHESSYKQAEGLRARGMESAALCSEAMGMAYKFCHDLVSVSLSNREEGRELQDFLDASIEKAKTKKPFDSFWEGWLGALIHVKMNYAAQLSPSSPLEQKELKDYKALYENLLPKYQTLVDFYDKVNGTPCEQIRERQKLEDNSK